VAIGRAALRGTHTAAVLSATSEWHGHGQWALRSEASHVRAQADQSCAAQASWLGCGLAIGFPKAAARLRTECVAAHMLGSSSLHESDLASFLEGAAAVLGFVRAVSAVIGFGGAAVATAGRGDGRTACAAISTDVGGVAWVVGVA